MYSAGADQLSPDPQQVHAVYHPSFQLTGCRIVHNFVLNPILTEDGPQRKE